MTASEKFDYLGNDFRNFRLYICKRELCEKLKFRESSSAAMDIQQNN